MSPPLDFHPFLQHVMKMIVHVKRRLFIEQGGQQHDEQVVLFPPNS